jgi:hypothetical protein
MRSEATVTTAQRVHLDAARKAASSMSRMASPPNSVP